MDPSLKNGMLVGPYRIRRMIGQGGMGEVYEAFEERVQRRVALKVLSTSNNLQKFVREARTLAAVNHPCIVGFYGIEEFNSVQTLAMEYVDGVTLRKFLDSYVLSAIEAAPVFLQILEGVRELHRNNIVHRDLTPGNIMLHSEGQVKLLDFGIAKQYGFDSEFTQEGIVVGTLQYLAPEILAGAPATSLSDLWSIGAVFYECVCGMGLAKSAPGANITPRFNKDCVRWANYELQKFILKLIANDPRARFSSADLAIQELQRLTKLWSVREAKLAPVLRNVGNLAEAKAFTATLTKSPVIAKRVLTLAAFAQKEPMRASPTDTEQLEVQALTIGEDTLNAALKTVNLGTLDYSPQPGFYFEPPPARTGALLLGICAAAALIPTFWYFRIYKPAQTQNPVAKLERKIASVEPLSLTRPPAHKLEAVPNAPAAGKNETPDPNSIKQLAAAEAKIIELEKNLKWLMEQKDKFGVPTYLLDDLEHREHELAQIDNDAAAAKTAHAAKMKTLEETARTANDELNAQLNELTAKANALRAELDQTRGEITGAQRRTTREEFEKINEQHRSLLVARDLQWAKYLAERSSQESEGGKQLSAFAEQRETKLGEIAQVRQNLELAKSRVGQESGSVDSKVTTIKREIASQKQIVDTVRAKLNH